ncbi:MAG: hypothetical protein NT020_13140, partial [Chloroflexales bacterium]|nr:hypothetical protein [Chloroflexales bacterium]
QGIVGTAAMKFDGNDEIVHRDPTQLTFAPYNQPWSASVWVKPTAAGSSAAILKGTLNAYSYQLSLNAGKPRFAMAGMTIEGGSQLSTVNPSHLVVTSNGTTLTMLVNGSSVASTSTSAGGNVFNRSVNIIPFTTKSQTCTASTYSAAQAYDNDLNTYALSNSETNPYWVGSNASTTRMDAVTIFSRVTDNQLYNFTIYISDTEPVLSTDPKDRVLQIKAASKWSYTVNNTVNDYITIPLPIGMSGKYFYIVANGDNRTLPLNEVRVSLTPTVTVGSLFNGIIDDVRLYRRALNSYDITRLGAMAWQPSTIDTSSIYPTWHRAQVTNIEADASIQSTTTDNNNNSQLSSGENSLWHGSIDTLAPRIATTNVNSTYSATISDRNLDTTKIATPCGNKLTFQNTLPDSLWFLQYMSVLDGTYKSSTKLQGSCKLSNYPELIQTNSQTISNTMSLAYGKQFAYLGGLYKISTLSVQSTLQMIQHTSPVTGNVIQLTTNRAKTKLYAVSTVDTLIYVTIFDILSDPLNPIPLSTFPIQMSPGVTITGIGISGTASADAFVILTDSSTPQHILSIDVSIPSNPQSGVTSTLNDGTTFGMAVQEDLLVLAKGGIGIIVYRIDATGQVDNISQYATPGYANNVFFNENSLQIIDDDEPTDDTTQVTTPNTLRTINLINSVVSNKAVLAEPITERNYYQHITPLDPDNIVGYRIRDVISYRPNETMILSSATDYPNNQRISIINTSGANAQLLSDSRVNAVLPNRISTNGQFAIAITSQPNITELRGFQISDARLDTYACDQLSNCTTIQSTVT